MKIDKNHQPVALSEALTLYLKRSGLNKRIDQANVIDEWAGLVGPQVARVTRAESVTADGRLRVRVTTAAWAYELSMMTPRILALINNGRTGRVREIRWIPDGVMPEQP